MLAISWRTTGIFKTHKRIRGKTFPVRRLRCFLRWVEVVPRLILKRDCSRFGGTEEKKTSQVLSTYTQETPPYNSLCFPLIHPKENFKFACKFLVLYCDTGRLEIWQGFMQNILHLHYSLECLVWHWLMDKQATHSPCELWQKELGRWWLFSVDQDMVSVNLRWKTHFLGSVREITDSKEWVK